MVIAHLITFLQKVIQDLFLYTMNRRKLVADTAKDKWWCSNGQWPAHRASCNQIESESEKRKFVWKESESKNEYSYWVWPAQRASCQKKVKVIKRKFFWKESESENIRIESDLPKELFLQLERKWKKTFTLKSECQCLVYEFIEMLIALTTITKLQGFYTENGTKEKQELSSQWAEFFYRMAITCIIKFSQSCVQWQLELDVASVRRRQRNTLPACNKNIGFFDSYSQFFPRHHSFCDFWSLAGNLMWKVHWLTNVIISESIFYSVGLF